MLARLKKSMDEKDDRGFTLIELLVVIIIIGILAAIAIPVFLNQRQKGVDAGIKADLKNAATAAETFATDSPTATVYGADAAAIKSALRTAGLRTSQGNVIEIAGGPAGGFCIRGGNSGGTTSATTFFWYDSKDGGLKSGGATATAPAGACAGTPTFVTVS